ncbi:MAG: Ig-like domain-containing protein [Thermodesulfobacteriota bacterium]|nr:MAG: Ig-like domain-containing protein [Thermodesulfobacteriota bacterium]
MKRTALFAVLLLMVLAFPGKSFADIFYVRADAQGDNSGSDWTNAFRSLPAELLRGSTYYIASGEYPGYTFDDPMPEDPALNFIYIKKAIPEDHGTDTGWEDYLGEGSADFEATLTFKAGYYEIDGQVGGGPGSWKEGHGIKVRHSGTSDQIKLIRISERVSNLVFKHVEMYFNTCTTCSGQDIFYSLSGGSDWTFRNCYMHHAGRVILLTFSSTSGVLIENSMLERNGVSSTQHSEVWIARDANNVILRNSVIADFVSTGGIIISRGENWDIYGNIFIWTENWGRRSMNGAIGSLSSSADYYARNVNVYNNTFVDLVEGGAGKIFPIYNEIGNVKAYNNLWYNSPATSFGPGVEHNYNWFMNSNEGSIFESAMQVGEGDPFIDFASGDFRLTSGTEPGIVLPELYDTDMAGIARGADGFWDRGAFEFESAAGEVNEPPSAYDDYAATAEDTPVAIDVLANDTDPEGDALTVSGLSPPGNGTAILNPDQTVTYTPAPGFTGTDSFTYAAHDGRSESNAATVTVTVSGGEALIANDDAYSTDEDSVLVVEAPGVLGNDTLEGSGPGAELVSGPVNGTVTLEPDGSFRYEPLPDYNGQDSFSYRVVTALSESNIAAVVLTVNPVNDSPLAADDSAFTFRGMPVVINVLANDSDIDGDALTVASIAAPQNGTAGINPDQTVTYTPAEGFVGIDSFTYRAYDGAVESNSATVTITVQDRPEAVDDTYSTLEDTPLQVAAPGVLGNDSGEGELTAQLVTGPSRGSLSLNSDGSFTYSPMDGYSGFDTFTYKAVSGGAESDSATVTITVQNRPEAIDDTYSTLEGTPLQVAAPGVLGNDSGEGVLTAQLVTGTTSGSLTLNPDGSFSYTPGFGYSGVDSFTYKAVLGDAESDTATVTITVQGRPEAVDDTYSTIEDTPLQVAAPGVLGNDSGEGVLTAQLVTGAANGSLTLNSDGSFVYSPATGYYGIDTFTYKALSGGVESNSATVSISVARASNTAPVGYQDSATTNFNTPVVIPVLANDIDADGDPLSVAAITITPPNGTATINPDNTVTFTPNPGFSGSDRFYYKATDGMDLSNTTRVTVSVKSNKPPVAVVDYATTRINTPILIDVAANDYDIDGIIIRESVIVLSRPGRGGTVVNNTDGTVTFTPAAGFTGFDYFYYNIKDDYGATSKSAKVTVKVER